MSSNRELLLKADMAVADLQNNGGYLNPEQENAFLRKLFVQPTLIGQCRRVVMRSPVRKVNKIGFAKRILRKGVSGTALNTAAIDGGFDPLAEATARAKPVTEQITLTSKEVIAEIDLPYDVIEDNIERGNIGAMTDVGGDALSGGIRDTIMSMIAERAAIDLEELGLNGDTTVSATDPYLALTDGWLKLSGAQHLVDANSSPVSRRLFTDGMKTLPSQYRRNRGQLRHYVATEQEIDYRETIAQRETAMGDSQLQSTAPVYAAGCPVEGVGLMPGASGMLTHPMNLLFGIQRQISVETDKDIRARTYIIVLSARIDFQIEETDAIVLYRNLGV